ncbi:MAG: hypothetical protein ACI8XC_001850 [Gammaproteobacteria bacterium]|jgi:uncharacterized protein YcbX
MMITQLINYPVKSLAGCELKQSNVKATGLENDRLMMLIDDRGKFITQRKFPQLALIKAECNESGIVFNTDDRANLTIDSDFQGDPIQVDVWDDECHGFIADNSVNDWFSKYLDRPVRLVRYNFAQPRPVDRAFSKFGDMVGFADDSPILLVSEASVADLNSRLENPVSYRNFRPNIVCNKEIAFIEDSWKKVRIGELEFDVAKQCSRCILTTVDPETGVKRSDKEPVETLSGYRRGPEGIMFGVNLIPRTFGTLRVGDTISVIE